MIKVFRRTVLAERQHARRAAKRKENNARQDVRNKKDQITAIGRDVSARRREERVERREDWELGSIKPKRDVGDSKATYGTLDYRLVQGTDLRDRELMKKFEPFGGKYLNIRKGDSVVILQGHDKGKIGILSSIDRRKATVTVKDLNKVRQYVRFITQF